MTLEQYLENRHPGGGRQQAYKDELVRVCRAFMNSGLADPKFETELTIGVDSKFWSCLSEAFVFDRLSDKIFPARPAIGSGPDFLISNGNRKIWIEVTCPEPVGIPAAWLTIQPSTVARAPFDAILLRWTSAIKVKFDRYLGGVDERQKGYLADNTVSDQDVLVVAVNGCQMRHGPFPALHGVSQFPYAVEAVFPIGPYQIQIDRETLQTVGQGHQMRASIPKPSGALISASAFLDPQFEMISAIWAMDFNGSHAIQGIEPSAVIHNPNAKNRLPIGYLPCDQEFVATPTQDGGYLLENVKTT